MEEVASNKIPLVLLSGGLDSTFAFYREMVKGNCDVLYVDTNVMQKKRKAERLARENIVNIVEKLTGNRVLERHFVDVTDTYKYGIEAKAFEQPIMWLTGAMVKVKPSRHSKVVISYVVGDQILSELHNLHKAWEALGVVTKAEQVPPLEFPLRFHTKLMLLEEMPKELIGKTWTCEIPGTTNEDGHMVYDECGECIPCLTQYGARQVFEKKHGGPYLTGEPYMLLVEEQGMPVESETITLDDIKEVC